MFMEYVTMEKEDWRYNAWNEGQGVKLKSWKYRDTMEFPKSRAHRDANSLDTCKSG